MKTSSFIGALPLAFAIILLSCCERIVYVSDKPSDGPSEEQPVPARIRYDTTVIVTGVEFPEGYDWQRDTAYGDVSCKIVMFRNFERVLEVPAGYSANVGADPDMHWVADGRLYTEFSSAYETFITRDGKDLFRFSGREMICGMMAEGSDLWTLGQDRDGSGFTLRKNGTEVLRSDTGILSGSLGNPLFPTGALYKDDGHTCFAWKTVQTVGVAKKVEWHVYEDGQITDLPYDSSASEVLDVRMVEGTICKAWRPRNAANGFMASAGDETYSISQPSPFTPFGCRIVPWGDGMILIGDIIDDKEAASSCIWDRDGLRRQTYGTLVTYARSGGITSDAAPSENPEEADATGSGRAEKFLARVTCSDDGDVGTVYGFTGSWSPAKETRMMTQACLDACGESSWVALTPKKGSPYVNVSSTNYN